MCSPSRRMSSSSCSRASAEVVSEVEQAGLDRREDGDRMERVDLNNEEGQPLCRESEIERWKTEEEEAARRKRRILH